MTLDAWRLCPRTLGRLAELKLAGQTRGRRAGPSVNAWVPAAKTHGWPSTPGGSARGGSGIWPV